MSVKHLFGRKDVYIIHTVYSNDGRPDWQYAALALHAPKVEANVEWNLLRSPGFGVGFRFGRNGSESDLGLDVHLGPLLSVWTRIRTPWTKWAQVDREQSDWYLARHTSIVLFPWEGCYFSAEWDNPEHGHGKRDFYLTKSRILGRTKTDTVTMDSGETSIPLPEGNYKGQWQSLRFTRRYVRFPGTLLDRIKGPHTHTSVNIDIPGGIPHWGKGENSWDCGMDGLMGVSGSSLEDAISNAVRSTLRDRKRYGGPNNLPRPMTIEEAEGYR